MSWLSKLFGEYAGSHYPSGIVNLTASCPQCTPGDRGECLTGAYADRDGGETAQQGHEMTARELSMIDVRFPIPMAKMDSNGPPEWARSNDVEIEQPISVPNWPARVGKR